MLKIPSEIRSLGNISAYETGKLLHKKSINSCGNCTVLANKDAIIDLERQENNNNAMTSLSAKSAVNQLNVPVNVHFNTIFKDFYKWFFICLFLLKQINTPYRDKGAGEVKKSERKGNFTKRGFYIFLDTTTVHN